MGNFAAALIIIPVVLSFAFDMLADKWRCEANGYVVQGRAIEKDSGIKFISILVGIGPELVFPADKCRKVQP